MKIKPIVVRVLVPTIAVAALVFAARTAAADPLVLSSDSFGDGKAIPPELTCDGADRSPPLHWDGPPESAKAFAIVVHDPDAPGGSFTHWIIYNIPAGAKALDEGMEKTGKLGDGSLQGTNDFGKVGYGGPCPPKGKDHRYVFTLYALSAPLELQPGAKLDAVLAEVKSKKVGETKLTGTYKRGDTKPS